MKTFKMIRVQDESGISGTGHVLDGVVFSTGQVVSCWLLRPNMPSSIGVYENWETFKSIHIDPHPGNTTKIVWDTEYVVPITTPRYGEVYREGIKALD